MPNSFKHVEHVKLQRTCVKLSKLQATIKYTIGNVQQFKIDYKNEEPIIRRPIFMTRFSRTKVISKACEPVGEETLKEIAIVVMVVEKVLMPPSLLRSPWRAPLFPPRLRRSKRAGPASPSKKQSTTRTVP